ncbi:MAG: toxin-antitoxin system YwqK family antitoxin [Nanobdellota archaeon]
MKRLILLLLLIATCAYADYYGSIKTDDFKANLPASLDEAVQNIEGMIDKGNSTTMIALTVASYVDHRIINNNDFERMTIASNWIPFGGDSEEEKRFLRWRDEEQGADKQYDEIAQWAWENEYGQCAENAATVYYILKHAGITDARIFSSGDHAFVVWGLGLEEDPNNITNWDDDVIIADSWQHGLITGKDAFENYHCGRKPRIDITWTKDNSVGQRCGLFSGRPFSPCCKTIPECRNDPRLACVDNQCKPCGRINAPCCEDEICNFDSLECKDGMCVDKAEETQEDQEESEETSSNEEVETAEDKSNDKYQPQLCPEVEIPPDARWVEQTTYDKDLQMGYTSKKGWVGELKLYWADEKDKLKGIQCYNVEGKKEGPYESYDRKGNKVSEMSYDDGKLTGLKKVWDGEQLVEESTWKEGKKHGTYETWDKNGNPKYLKTYDMGQLEGQYKEYHYNTDRIKIDGTATAGKLADSKTYDKEGNVLAERHGSYDEKGSFSGWVVQSGNRCEVMKDEYSECTPI